MVRTVKKGSVQDSVYQILKEGILSVLLPPGTVMSTQEMATKLNVSRTPVREAFIRLQEEGLVDIFPQRETLVSQIDLKRVSEERFIRKSLELAMVDLLVDNCSEKNIVELRYMIEDQKKYQTENEYVRMLECDNQMHRQFFLIAGRPLAWETIQTVNGHDYRFRLLAIRNGDIMRTAIAQHEKIIDLLEKKDRTSLSQELSGHLQKWNLEKEGLLRKYPDYFKTEESGLPFQIGKLL